MQKIKAIVVKSNDRKEKDKNILLFSIEQGKFWATLKGVKGANAKMKLAQNPFTFADFVLEDGKAGKIVTGFDCIESFYEISQDVDKYFCGTAILEIINATEFSSESESAQIFVETIKALKTLCFSKSNPIYVLDKFLLSYFEKFGYPIYVDKCSTCKTVAFDKSFLTINRANLFVKNARLFLVKSLQTQHIWH